jgi:acetyl esterase/lipase
LPARDAAHAPPAFITAGSLDQCCAAPSVALYQQLREAHVPAELHMYAGADHAFNLDESNRISILHWPDRLADWLADEGWLDGSASKRPPAR